MVMSHSRVRGVIAFIMFLPLPLFAAQPWGQRTIRLEPGDGIRGREAVLFPSDARIGS